MEILLCFREKFPENFFERYDETNSKKIQAMYLLESIINQMKCDTEKTAEELPKHCRKEFDVFCDLNFV